MAANLPPPPPPPPPPGPMPPPPGPPGVEVVNISVGNPPPPRGNMPGGAPPQFQMPLQFAPGWAQQQQNFDPEYRGFVLRKALPEPGQRFNWNRVRVTEFQVPLSDLNAKGREARWKQTVTNKYDSLRTDAQRNQIDDLVADQNQKEPNPFAEWHLAEIEVRMREFLVAPFRKATETSQIRVILKKVPRSTARPWDEGRPRVFDIDKPPQQQQFQPLPPPMMPPPPVAPGPFQGGPLPPILPAPPQVINGGNKTNTQGPTNKPPTNPNPNASKSPKAPNGKNKESRSSSPASQRRRNESKDRLDAKLAKLAKLNMLLNAAGINDSNHSEDDSEYDSDDSLERMERLHHKKKGKHVERVGSKSRLPLIGQQRPYAVQPPPIGRPTRADNCCMSGALPTSARGRSLTRDHLHRLESVRSNGHCMGSSESLNGGQRLKERVVREKFASSDSDSWEDIGSRSSVFSASSSHYSGTAPSSLGSGHYRKAYRDRERSLSRARNPRSGRSRSRGRYYEHRKPPSYGRPRSETDSYSSDDSFRERTVKTKEVHHHLHHWRPQPATTFTDPFRGGQIATLPRPIQPPQQPRAITYTEPQHQPAYIPPAPVAPGAYAQQPTYQQQGVQAQNYMDRRDNRSSYPTMAREVADAFERGREKQREIDEVSERRRRIDELRREERERVDHIHELRRAERGSVISGISTAPPNIPPGYGYIGAGAPADYRHHYPRPRSRSRDRYNRY